MITEWDKLVNRIKLETNQRLTKQRANGNHPQAVVAIKVSMLMDCNGDPITWIVDSANVEPAARAKTLLELYASY